MPCHMDFTIQNIDNDGRTYPAAIIVINQSGGVIALIIRGSPEHMHQSRE